MDLKVFYDSIRKDIKLTDENVKGFDTVLGYLERVIPTNVNHAAYVLATAYWETAKTMQPVREAFWKDEAWRKKNLRYFPYYGRGYVQLTWDYNYKKASDYFGVDFVKNPDLVMDTQYALPILVVGMQKGWFTGKDMDDYIDDIDEIDDEDFKEYVQARRVVNGTDKADQIAKLALIFEKALKEAGYGLKQPQEPVEELPDEEAMPDYSNVKSLLEALYSLLDKWFGKKGN